PRNRTRWRRCIARALFEVHPVEDDVFAFAGVDLETPTRVLPAAVQARGDPADDGGTAQLGCDESRPHVAVARPYERLQAGRGVEQLRSLDVARAAVALARLEIEIDIRRVRNLERRHRLARETALVAGADECRERQRADRHP